MPEKNLRFTGVAEVSAGDYLGHLGSIRQSLRRTRQSGSNRGAISGRLNAQFPAELHDPLAHAAQADSATTQVQFALFRRGNASAEVLYHEAHPIILLMKADRGRLTG
jgi:hypothetical protein